MSNIREKKMSFSKNWENKNNCILLLLIGCLFFLSCLPTSSTTINGYVRDYTGKPVAGADVSFGGTLNKSKTKTDNKGFYEITARHRPTQMLYLEISKPGVGTYTDKFPGFSAPEDGKTVELRPVIQRQRK